MMFNDEWTSDELVTYIEKYAPSYVNDAFQGVFPIDELPRWIDNLPITLISNTQSSNLPGEHWIALYVSKTKYGEYFDSLGRAPPLEISSWLNKFCRKWIRNTK